VTGGQIPGQGSPSTPPEDVKQALVKIEGKSLWAQQAEAIAALLRAPEIEAAAAMLGLDEAVLRRWLEDPRFRARYREARRAFLEDATDRLQQLVGGAVEALARNLTCGVPEVEVEAARVILAHAMPGAGRPARGGEAREDGHAPGHGGRR
jgi:hypothetical protein